LIHHYIYSLPDTSPENSAIKVSLNPFLDSKKVVFVIVGTKGSL